jgi:hypothetical protein
MQAEDEKKYVASRMCSARMPSRLARTAGRKITTKRPDPLIHGSQAEEEVEEQQWDPVIQKGENG